MSSSSHCSAVPSVRWARPVRVMSPIRRNTSCTSSRLFARRWPTKHCSSNSRSARTPASSSSRSSSAPKREFNKSRSRDNAAARRSANGASPSYMYAAIQLKVRLCANGDAFCVSTLTTRIERERMRDNRSHNAGTSNTSCRHSRLVSNKMGNVGYFAATASRSAAR